MLLKIVFIIVSIAIASIFVLVINRAIKDKNIKQKFIINLIITLSLLLLFLFSFLIDLNLGVIKLNSYLYFALPFFGVFLITNFVFLGLYINKYKGIIKKRREDLKERLYLVIKKDKDFYLEETKEGLKGIEFKVSKSIIFHDEMLNKIIKRLNLKVLENEYLGSFTENEKIRFHCYYLEIENDLENYKKIYEMDLVNQKYFKFHEEIIYKIILHQEISERY
ncbi:MAG: hypothetical protein ACOX4W_03295 [Bacilli bacterium]